MELEQVAPNIQNYICHPSIIQWRIQESWRNFTRRFQINRTLPVPEIKHLVRMFLEPIPPFLTATGLVPEPVRLIIIKAVDAIHRRCCISHFLKQGGSAISKDLRRLLRMFE